MNKNLNLLFAGGDMRQIYAAKTLENMGHTVKKIALDDEAFNVFDSGYDLLVLPAPCSKDKKTLFAPFCKEALRLEDLKPLSKPDLGIVCGGAKALEGIFESKTKIYDILKDDEYNILNSVASAEGAIARIIQTADFNICGSNVLITGFGKIGKQLAPRLGCFGAKVYVAARKETDLALAEAMGFETVEYALFSSLAHKFDIIINTVPNTVITQEVIKNLKKDCIVFDLASNPGGVDFAFAEKQGIKVFWELGLPGRYSPKSSGKIIAKTILKIAQGKKEQLLYI